MQMYIHNYLIITPPAARDQRTFSEAHREVVVSATSTIPVYQFPSAFGLRMDSVGGSLQLDAVQDCSLL